MKNIRRVLSLVMALAMVMTLAIGAFAAETEEGKGIIRVEKTDDLSQHNYVAYQIFKGNISGGVLTDIEWGNAITDNGKVFLQGKYKDSATEAKDSTARTVALFLTDANIEQFAKDAAGYLVDGTGTTLHEGDNKVDYGYYLIRDEKNLDNTNHANTAYILHVIGEKTLNPKHSVPTVDKKQHTEESDQYKHDALDTYIGGTVSYELTGTIPDTLATYDHYWYEFHDTLTEGLTAKVDEEDNLIHKLVYQVKVDGGIKTTEIPATVEISDGQSGTKTHTNYTVTITDGTRGEKTVTKIDIAITDLHNVLDKEGNKVDIVAGAGSAIVVTYEATLNEKAVIGNPGNPNYVDLEFSNNPNNTGDGTEKPDDTGKTPEKVVFVFTYKVDGDKIQANNEKVKLAGAEFQLQRSSDSKWYYVNEKHEIEWIEYDEATATETSKKPTVVKSDINGVFGFEGLDAGVYKLWETKAPDGYDKPSDPFTFTIRATLNNNKLTALSITVGSAEAQGNTDDGSVKIQIENKKGATLPSTGGMGTTLFYIVGAILVLTSSVLLITKKRMA